MALHTIKYDPALLDVVVVWLVARPAYVSPDSSHRCTVVSKYLKATRQEQMGLLKCVWGGANQESKYYFTSREVKGKK